MADKLSQQEIDALFAQVKAGSDVEVLKEENIKVVEYEKYDFNRPEKFSIENLKSISSIFNRFSKSLSQTLTGKLRTSVSVEFLSFDQLPFVTEYADVINKDDYAFCVTNFGYPDMHDIVLEFDLAFLKSVHSRWLGGLIDLNEHEKKPLTDFEQITLEKFMKSCILDELAEAFVNVAPINPTFVKYETDPQMLKIAPNNDMAALIALEIKTKQWSTSLKACIPFFSIEAVISRLNSESIREFKGEHSKKFFKEEIEKNLKNVKEKVYISLGKVGMEINDLAELKVGDLILLDQKVNEPVKGFAAGIHKFDCYIGKSGSKKAMRFENFVENERTLEELKKKQIKDDVGSSKLSIEEENELEKYL